VLLKNANIYKSVFNADFVASSNTLC